MDWSVAKTLPNHEALAVQDLGRVGVATYHPRFHDGHLRDGSPRLKSLFPGYLFMQACAASWRTVLGARGVTGVLGLSGEGHCGLVPDKVVQDIRAQECGEDGAIVLPDPYRIGVRVRVGWRSPLFGREGVSQGMGGGDRVWVLLQFMEREVRINFRRVDLAVA